MSIDLPPFAIPPPHHHTTTPPHIPTFPPPILFPQYSVAWQLQPPEATSGSDCANCLATCGQLWTDIDALNEPICSCWRGVAHPHVAALKFLRFQWAWTRIQLLFFCHDLWRSMSVYSAWNSIWRNWNKRSKLIWETDATEKMGNHFWKSSSIHVPNSIRRTFRLRLSRLGL